MARDAIDALFESGGMQIGAMGDVPQGIANPAAVMKKLFVTIPSTPITTATTGQDVTIQIAQLFRPGKLVLSTAAQALQVNNIRIGTVNLNVGQSGAVPGNAFSEQAVDNDLIGYTAEPGPGIVINVANDSGGTLNLRGVFYGWAAIRN